MANLLLLVEIGAGLFGIFSLASVRRQFGNTAAAATGTASGLVLAHALYELSRRLGEARSVQALSLLAATATFLLVLGLFVPPAESFLSRHTILIWCTPLLAAIGWGTGWAVLRFGFWGILAFVWVSEAYSDPEIGEIGDFIFSSPGSDVKALGSSSACPGTVQTIVLDREFVSINPGGRCYVRWGFSGQIDVILSDGTQFDSAGSNEKFENVVVAARSANLQPVALTYLLTTSKW